MNPVEHQATVDKGLKMKIKRKNLVGGATSPKNDSVKLELAMKGDAKGVTAGGSLPSTGGGVAEGGNGAGGAVGGGTSALDKLKQTLVDKEKMIGKQLSSTAGAAVARGANKRAAKDKAKEASTGGGAGGAPAVSSVEAAVNGGATNSVMVELNKVSTGTGSNVKLENTSSNDPYEFNAKVEDRIGLPVKKIKLEKMETPNSPGAAGTHNTDVDKEQRDVGTETCSVAIATDPDCLGPCEPGTSVILEGIVWNETENGILVVNVTWRGKTYVGTLMDTTKHVWAPPRLNCESPANEEGTHTPRGRGKRGRNAVTPPVVDLGERRLRKRRTNNNNPYAAPPSPAKSEAIIGVKRRGRPVDLEISLDNLRPSKRARMARNGTANHVIMPENGFIECPEPNCMKKYKHINGLKYHQAHAHKKYCSAEDGQESPEEKKSPEDEKCPHLMRSQGSRKVPPTSDCHTEHSGSDLKSENGKNKKNRKEDKLDHKKLNKQPTVALTPVSLDSKSSVYPSTVSSLGSVTTMSVLPSTAGTQSTATTSITTLPITTATTSLDKMKKVKGDKKNKGLHRAAASATAGGAMPAAGSSQTQISIAASPVQSGSGLKPIQPKPTVLGETSTVNPLVGLKEKKVKKKKNKDKEHKSGEKNSEHKLGSSKDSPKLADYGMSDLSAPSLSSSLGGSKPLEALAKMSSPPELQKQTMHQPNLSPPELQKQPPALVNPNSAMKAPDSVNARPPSSLSLNSPMADTSNLDGKDQSTNAQSPAYSDISDANDSSTNLDTDIIEIKKEPQERQSVAGHDGTRERAPSDDRQSGQNYHSGVFPGYYPPSSYHSPSASSPQASREVRSSGAGGCGSGSSGVKPQGREMDKSLKSIDSSKKVEQRDAKQSDVPLNGSRISPSPGQMREYQEQVLRAQQMAQYQQYLGAYGYGVDMRALASNPEYKAQYEWMMEQERVRREYMEQQKMAVSKGGSTDGQTKPVDASRPLDLNTKAMDLSKQGKSSPSSRSSMTACDLYNNKRGATDGSVAGGSKVKDNTIQSSTEGKNERNCDGQKEPKNHMDARGATYPPGFERRQEEYKRYFMYQQQRLLEQKHLMEQQAKDGENRKQQLHGRDPQTPSPHHREAMHSMTQPQQQGYPRETHALSVKSSHSQQEYQHQQNSELKLDKDKCKSSTPVSNSLPASPAGKPKDQRESQPSTPNSYGQYYQQGYPGYGSHIPYDPNQSGYTQNPLIGYVSAPNNYPSYAATQMRGGYSDGTKDRKSGVHSPVSGKSSALPPAPQEGKALELLQQKAANYYNSQSPQSQHTKITELKDINKMDKASPNKDLERPDSRNSLLTLGKDKDHDDTSPPPTQRHIHTHHHTHLVGPAYPLYGSYNALIATQKAAAAAAAAAAAVSYRRAK